MPVRKKCEKRTATPEEKAEKKRSEAERTEKLRQHFPTWTGKYRSGGRPSLKEIAIFMNLADEEEASEILNHMRMFVFESGTGYKKLFDQMAFSDKNRAFVTLTSVEIFSMKLFLEHDWPESVDEQMKPPGNSWSIRGSVGSTDHAREEQKEAGVLFRMKHSKHKEKELEQKFGDGARVKRKRLQAIGSRKHAKVNGSGAEASLGASRQL